MGSGLVGNRYWFFITYTSFVVPGMCQVIVLVDMTMKTPWPDEEKKTEKAEALAEETKALKMISFPEMDSDGQPSSHTNKVLTCTGKWQMKMHDLANGLDKSNPAMQSFPICKSYSSHSQYSIAVLLCGGPLPLGSTWKAYWNHRVSRPPIFLWPCGDAISWPGLPEADQQGSEHWEEHRARCRQGFWGQFWRHRWWLYSQASCHAIPGSSLSCLRLVSKIHYMGITYKNREFSVHTKLSHMCRSWAA